MNLAGGVGLLVVYAPVAGGALVTMNGQVLWGHPSPCMCCGVSAAAFLPRSTGLQIPHDSSCEGPLPLVCTILPPLKVWTFPDPGYHPLAHRPPTGRPLTLGWHPTAGSASGGVCHCHSALWNFWLTGGTQTLLGTPPFPFSPLTEQR